jgi:hypothetical protein
VKTANNIERSIQQLRYSTTAVLDERILADAQAALEQSKNSPLDATRSSVWRTIMSSTWTRVAGAAAAIALVMTVSLTALHQSAAPAYALEQTRAANRGLRYIHIRIAPAYRDVTEAWVQLGPQGEFQHLRMEIDDALDGPKSVIWQADRVDVWFKAKNAFTTLHAADEVARVPELLRLFDPRAVADALYEAEAAGKVQLETTMSPAPGEPIVLVATSLPTAEQQDVYRIDPATKLVQRVERYQRVSGQYELQSGWDYLEYNQTPDASVFVLNPPANVIRVDQTAELVGLTQGELSDEQIAAQVVRKFFEALIAKDYAEAGRLLSGMPADYVEKTFKKMTFVQIVSIGEPTAPTMPGVAGLVVSCQVKIETNGTTWVREFEPIVRPVHGQPDRWEISGGI